MISAKEAVLRIDPDKFGELFHPVIAQQEKDVLCRGLPASPGAVSGPVVFTPADAVALSLPGDSGHFGPL